MPNIRIVGPGNQTIRANDSAADAVVNAGRTEGYMMDRIAQGDQRAANLQAESENLIGRSIAGLGRSLTSASDAYAVYEDHETRQAVGQGAAVKTGIWSDLSKQWNDLTTNTDPNDATIAPKFLADSVEPALQKFVDSMPTDKSQQWAQEQAASLRQHFFEKTAADTASRAGTAAIQNLHTTQQNLSVGAFNDPTSGVFAHDQVDETFAALTANPNLSAEQIAKMREQILPEMHKEVAASEFRGKLDRNPQAAMAELASGHFDKYITGTEKAAFEKAGEGIIKKKRAEAEHEVMWQDHLKTEASNKNYTDFLGAIQAKPDGTIVIPPGVLDKALKVQQGIGEPGQFPAMLSLAERSGKEGAAQLDPETFKDLSSRLFDATAPTSPADIIHAAADGKISVQQAQQLEGNRKLLEDTPLQGPLFKTAVDAAEAQIMAHFPGFNVKDETGMKLQSAFMNDFLPRYVNASKQAGGAPANALDLKDPKSLISQSLAQYQRTPQQKMSDLATEFGGLGGLGAPTGALPGTAPAVPESLRAVKNPHYNPVTQQWGDPATGTIYDNVGKEVK